jgi:hypothetical protein
MAEQFPRDGAAANGFGSRSLHDWEARFLYEANYPAASDFRGPPSWRLSVGGVYIPPPQRSMRRSRSLSPSCRTRSGHSGVVPGNHAAWDAYFRERYERELASFEGPPPPPARNNSEGRHRWWSTLGRTLAAFLGHIQTGNSPIPQMPSRTLASISRRRESFS